MFDIIRTYVQNGDKMRRFGRRKRERCLELSHKGLCFKPCGKRAEELDEIELFEDELEAIRLSDHLGLYQEEAALKMNISRTTFSRIVSSARKKVAEALLDKKILIIKESKVQNSGEKILACNNSKCVKRNECKRYELFEKGAKEYSTNGGTPEKGCKKFIPREGN